MEWMQVYTIIGTTLGGTLAACLFFYVITAKRMDRMEIFHREDMKSMDSKWERLFEKLLLKEQGKEG